MNILCLVSDLVLDFANKLAKVKCDGSSDNERVIIKDDFLSKMLLLRERYPELLFINYPSGITKDEADSVFRKIKESVTDVYQLDNMVCPQFRSFVIDGFKLELPGIEWGGYEEFGGVFNIDYDSVDNKVACINQTLLHCLILLPIKKITITFVDLKCSYEYELLLRNLPSILYNEKPVTSDEQMDRLLNRLEKRREDVIKKYGNYGEYCKKSHSTPLPYEVIVLYDEYYDKKYHDRLNSLIEWCKRIGVLIIIPRKKSKVFNLYEPYIVNPNGKELYIAKDIKENKWWEGFNYMCNNNYTGLFINSDVISLYNPMPDFPDYNKPKDLIEEIQSVADDSNVIIGSGEYEVWIEKSKHIDDFDFDRIESQKIKNMIIDTPAQELIGCFQTEKEAEVFVDLFCIENYLPTFVGYAPVISLDTYLSGFWATKASLELYIDKERCSGFFEDLKFYFHQFGFTNEMANRIFGLLSGTISANNSNEIDDDLGILCLRYWKVFPSKEDAEAFKIQLISHINNQAKILWGDNYIYSHIHIHDGGKCDYYFPSGKNCLQYENIHVVIKKKSHIVIPLEHYEVPKNDGIINFTPITSNEILLKACFDYIRTEAEAKDEMKVQTLDFGSAAKNKYETDLSTMIIPVGKAEAKDADFRLDLVSHVHSFIIGQSGSGKSVFLHNIIGGAMLKYAPEDLQLYLLDFKLGGVEFNRYQGAKHVKALLVDNSDPQVTLEILRELRNSMTERGKLLRNAGVNNIGEYNKMHQQDRMPHVLVVADECHEMFKADDSIPRQVRNEISDIVIKIAKEGRSQGVHLVFATQTLSGTEISSEIINNVSDFYLLKCAQTDSERLVPNSSTITSELSTGQIYYYHVDEQVKFQAYYTDKEAAEKLMAAIVEKAKDHKSNGEFYFNGAQMFYLDESVKEQIQNVKGKSPVAFMGKAIDISQKDLYIKLNEDFSENVLLLGLNDQEQVTRTTMNLFVSLMMSAKLKHKDIAFKVIDCLNNEEGDVHELLFDLENAGLCEIIERRQRSKFFKDFAQGVLDGTAEETILLILGQDRFRELKMDMELEDGNMNPASSSEDFIANISAFMDGDSDDSSHDDRIDSQSTVRTYREALNIILDKGPDYGVHTLLQIEKASNLLFEDYITPKVVFQKFKHLVMLKSDETAGVTLHLNDEIRLEKLSSDWERLRAYYYAEESDSYTLFTPYMPSKSKEIINLLETI